MAATAAMLACLQECSRTPAEVAQEASLKTRLEEQTQMVSKLEHSVAVLKAKARPRWFGLLKFT